MTTAVLAIHFQNDVLHPEGQVAAGLAEHDSARAVLLRNARRLLDGARQNGVHVVSVAMVFPPGHAGVVQNSEMFRGAVRQGALVEGTWGAEFHEDLQPHGQEPVVAHSRINGFYGSDLDEVLRGVGARRLVVAGVATHSSVEHTARDAADAGYEVVVAADACAAGDPELHEAGLRTLAVHVARVSTVDEIVSGLGGSRG